MSLTVTLHLWWLWAYLAIGLVVWLPGEYVAWRKLGSPKRPFWPALVDSWHPHRVLRIVVPITAWPLAWWECLR